MAILGQAAAVLYGTTAPSNTDVIWAETTTNDPNTWSIVAFKAYQSGSWVTFSNPVTPAAGIPTFSSAAALTAYTGPANQALFSFTDSGKDYNFLMQRISSARSPNGLSIVDHATAGDVWMRVGGTPIVFTDDLGAGGATQLINKFFVGYTLEEIKIQTAAGLDLRLLNGAAKDPTTNLFEFGANVQGKILIEIK
jgi:hypothetical protein